MSVLEESRSEAGRPRRRRVQPRLQVERGAGGAGAQAGEGDGGVEAGLRLPRLRAQPLPRVPLPPGPRAVLQLRAGPAQGAVGLPARARARRAPGAHEPSGGGVHDRRAPVASASSASRRSCSRRPRRRWRTRRRARDVAPSQGDFGHTMVYSPDKAVAQARPGAGGARRGPCSPAAAGATVLCGQPRGDRAQPRVRRAGGRPQRVPPPRGAAPRAAAPGRIRDLGSTNGIKVNRRRVDQARAAPRRSHHAGHHGPRLRARVGGPRPWTSRWRWR